MEEEAAQCDKFSELGRAAATHPSSNANSHRVLPPSLLLPLPPNALTSIMRLCSNLFVSGKEKRKVDAAKKNGKGQGEVEMEDEVEFEVEVTRELVTKLAISLYPTHPLSQLKTLSFHSVTL